MARLGVGVQGVGVGATLTPPPTASIREELL